MTEVKETQKPAELHIVPIPPEMGTRLGDILQTMNRKDNLHERQVKQPLSTTVLLYNYLFRKNSELLNFCMYAYCRTY